MYPFNEWTNERILSHLDSRKTIKGAVRSAVNQSQSPASELYSTPFQVFAFQEVDAQRGTPQNDKAMYSAMISTVKAAAFEKSALAKRKKGSFVYCFNHATVVDS